MIWSTINDSRNNKVIEIEKANIENFAPKNTIKSTATMETVENPDQKISELIEHEYKHMNFLDIIIKKLLIIINLRYKLKKVDIRDVNFNEYVPGLQWILDSSLHIAQVKNVPVTFYENNDKTKRGSYKFCRDAHTCYATYGNLLSTDKTRKHNCTGDHFVHHKLAQDIHSIITVLSAHPELIIGELRTGLNTAHHVIDNMYNELMTFQTYFSKTPNFDINFYYRVRSTCQHDTGS
jgi:hypothetical protein